MINTGRAVEVRCLDNPQAGGKWTAATGYMIGGHWVITAAHSVLHQRSSISVVIPGTRQELSAGVVFHGGDETDIALLSVTDAPVHMDGLSVVRWARVNRSSVDPLKDCWATGFPQFKEFMEGPARSIPARDPIQVQGTIHPGTDLNSGRLALEVTTSPRTVALPGVSQWQGMSGALVFVRDENYGDLAVGVVTDHRLPEGGSSLTVTPLERLPAVLHSCDDPETKSAAEFLGLQSADNWLTVPEPRYVSASGAPGKRRPGFVSATAEPVARRGIPPALANETFVGRTSELAAIKQFLELDDADEQVACVISGPPGVGKTALVAHAAYRAERGVYGHDGVYYINIYGYDDSRRVDSTSALAAVLRALGISSQHIPADMGGRLAAYDAKLSEWRNEGHPYLLVLDNARDPAIAEDLMPSPPHKLLVTSRESMSDIPGARLHDLDVLDSTTAEMLVRKVLLAARGDDHRLTDDPMPVTRLIDLCDRLPLALRIAAALLAEEPDLSVADLVGELEIERARLDRLKIRDHMAVRQSLALSFTHLPSALKKTFMTLSLHPGKQLTAESLARLCGLTDDEMKSQLRELRRVYLVRGGIERDSVWLHELVRLYSRELCIDLRQPEENARAIERLMMHYAAKSDRANRALQATVGGDARLQARNSALAWLDLERSSILATLNLGVDRGAVDFCYRLGIDLGKYMEVRYRASDWVSSAQVAVEAAESISAEARARASLNMGAAQWIARSFQASIEWYRRAVQLSRNLPNARLLSDAELGLGIGLWALESYLESEASLVAADASASRAGYTEGRARALAALGNTQAERGQIGDALKSHSGSVALLERLGDDGGLAIVRLNLAASLWRAGRGDEAITALQQAIPVLQSEGSIFLAALGITSLGNAYAGTGWLDQAAEKHITAQAMFEEIGDRYGVGRALLNLATVLKMLHRHTDAEKARATGAEILSHYEHQHGHQVAVIRLGTRPGEPWLGAH
jgi:tetratricopeptide (TPR) repeat protein